MAFILFLSGRSQNKDVPFTYVDASGRQPTSWNKVLKLEFAKGVENSLRFGSTINLDLTNLSGNSIRFPQGFNLRIFDFTDGVKEIKNDMQYTGAKYIIFPSIKQLADPVVTVSFNSQIQADTNHKIRVFVIGEMLNDDPQKTQLVGAYMDIEMHP